MRQWLPKQWYARHAWIRLFAPMALLYRFGIFLRKKAYCYHLLPSRGFPVPVIVVGNMTVGGTGKTPLVMTLVQDLKRAGFSPGIVSRGYLGSAPHYPYLVEATSPVHFVGDEALEMQLATGVPVVVSPDRSKAVALLLKNTNINVVISDDGLQHYALQRSLEIGVIDGVRRFGNGWCLPVGPCREPQKNWAKLPLRVCHGEAKAGEYAMKLNPIAFVNVLDPNQQLPLTAFTGQSVYAVTGIGNPQRFTQQLDELAIDYQTRFFADHHAFTENDFIGCEEIPVIMTGKDAVKCRAFASKNWWFLSVSAECDPALLGVVRDHAASYTGTTTP